MSNTNTNAQMFDLLHKIDREVGVLQSELSAMMKRVEGIDQVVRLGNGHSLVSRASAVEKDVAKLNKTIKSKDDTEIVRINSHREIWLAGFAVILSVVTAVVSIF
jgi:hypothetical protein